MTDDKTPEPADMLPTSGPNAPTPDPGGGVGLETAEPLSQKSYSQGQRSAAGSSGTAERWSPPASSS